MTMPDERYRALLRSRDFLRDLLDPKKTPRVPKDIRKQAYWCLRHFPYDYQLEMIAEALPEDFENADKTNRRK